MIVLQTIDKIFKMLQSTIILLFFAFLFIYLVVYKRSSFLGNIAYATLGIAILLGATTSIDNYIGILILLIGLVNTILSIFSKSKSK